MSFTTLADVDYSWYIKGGLYKALDSSDPQFNKPREKPEKVERRIEFEL